MRKHPLSPRLQRGKQMMNDGESSNEMTKVNRSLSISSPMKTNTSAAYSNIAQPYVQLQQEVHDALRVQHPEWIEPNGDCPTCESYESRLAELLGLASPRNLR